MEGGQELGLVEDFVGELGDEFAQPVGAVSVAAAGYRQVQPEGHLGREAIFLVRSASVGDFDGVDHLEHRMLHRGLGILGYRFVGIRIEVRAGTVVLSKNAAERVRRHYEATNGVGGFAQFFGPVESALVPIYAEGQDMAHIGVCFHRADQDHVMLGGEGGEFVPVPGSGVFGDAQATETQTF